MSRREEYLALMEELDQPIPELENTVARALKRKKRRNKLLLRPLAGAAACFAAFVLLVNFCAPVAYACSRVPGLRILAEAVTFSKFLRDAVENDFVQPLSLTQQQAGITASVEYLIVDQKQVNVFFRLDSDIYNSLSVDPAVRLENGHFASCSYALNNHSAANDDLQSITIDFVEEDVPDRLRLQLSVRDAALQPAKNAAPASDGDYLLNDLGSDLPEYLAVFDFLLEFDPAFTAAGKIYPVNQAVELEGQTITITQIEVYPTHLRVNIEETDGNTAWIEALYFYIEIGNGKRFDISANGITATGSTESPSMISYRADSPYFYEAEHLKLVITGAEWLRKDRERLYVNLQTGQTGPLPEGVSLQSVKREGNSWILEWEAACRKKDSIHQIFSAPYYDAAGNQYSINCWGSLFGEPDNAGEIAAFLERISLRDYPYDEVWLCPRYSHVWTAEDPIIVTVQ